DAGRDPGHRQARLHVEVLVGVDRDDAVARLGGGRVDRDDLGVRPRGAHPGGPQLAREVDVVHVGGLALDQARVLLAAQRLSDVPVAAARRLCGGAHGLISFATASGDSAPACDGAGTSTVPPSPPFAASRTALTMLW